MLNIRSLFVLFFLCSVVMAENEEKKDQNFHSMKLNSTSTTNKEDILISLEKPENVINVTSTVANEEHKSREGVQNRVIFTEGGSLLFNNNRSLPMVTISPSSSKPFLQPEEENKESSSSKNTIHARKGVDMNIPNTNNMSTLLEPVDIKINVNNKTTTVLLNTASTSSNQTSVTYKVIETVSDQPPSTKKPPHKPTLTISFDEVHPNSTLLLNNSKIETHQATLLKNKDNSPNNSRSEPGFIIPLVITLFAVPMLGFIGYQAIKRGREAWKNRHYRRMDFLIDGMYND